MKLSEKINTIISDLDLNGKNYDSYATPSNVGSKIASTINEEYNLTDWNSHFEYDTDAKTGSCAIIFRDHDVKRTLANIRVHKSKGRSHYTYFGSYCDWTVKSIDADIYEEDIAKTIADVRESYVKSVIAKNEKFEKSVKAYELLMDTFGLSTYEVEDLIETIRNNRWTIREKLSKK